MRRLSSWIALLTLLLPVTVAGRDLFTYRISVDGSAATKNGNNDIRDFVELFDNGSLKDLFPGYTPQSSVVALLNVRGLHGILSFERDSPVLRLAFPELGLDVRFPGGSREESQELLEEWLKGLKQIKDFAESADLTLLLQAAVKFSPVDPAAGNPNSLQSRMFMADFDRAITSPRVSLSGDAAEAGKAPGTFNVDLTYGSWGVADVFDVQAVGLSFGGLINFGNRHWAMLMDWPFLGTWTEDAESVMTYPGLGVQYRVTDWWHLTAFARAGIVGSLKVGALAGMYSATLTSYLHQDYGKVTVGWGLMSGFNHTINDIEIDNYNVTYDLLNYPLRTGLDVSGPLGFRLGRKQATWALYGNYTHLFGSDLFLQDFSEVGVGFHLRTEKNGSRVDWMRLQAGYLFGDDYQGISTRLSFAF